ncbi:LAETG motif-containing sortase-dependent surface protein [Streptomyces flavofungini]|uniref:LAETG motif-containing sortase-dependent surface protein n=1 Tax=Streptomyces flavofungini TaxID=68200 RepID=UPI0025B1C7F6|nr:LAETG motif-containing sortase-dependent surface protein [Streptomyces flavofungini]WJV48633.1 LAETG motif-containing sortase-dependent surface protein [Streptomyces flavofungini]
MFSALSGRRALKAFAISPRRRRGAARIAAATVASGLVVAGATATATAAAAVEAPQHRGGASATLGGLKTYGQAVVREGGESQRIPAGLFEMSVDNGGTLQTYCIDLYNPTQKDAKYQETPWSGTSLNGNPHAGKIRWILQHSYPRVNNLAQLARQSGAGTLTEKSAAAGTQVAIWRYSESLGKGKSPRASSAPGEPSGSGGSGGSSRADGSGAASKSSGPGAAGEAAKPRTIKVEAVDPRAEKLADYLERSARTSPEPKASLTLEPAAVSGNAGKRLGPVTVRTDAESVTVTPPADSASGVKVVGKDGKQVKTARDGSRLFFDVPKGAPDGTAALEVQAATTVPVGRAFTSDTRSQTQILAGSSESTVSAAATAHWAEKGAIPALSAEKNCAKNGVDITASNKGDAAFTFSLMRFKHTIKAGERRTVTIPLQEDQPYDFTIMGPGGFEKRFKGVLDCRTEGSAVTVDGKAQPASNPSPASAGGTSGGGDLAETGGSNATPLIAAIAVVLVVVGGGAVFLLRRKKDPAEPAKAAPSEE